MRSPTILPGDASPAPLPPTDQETVAPVLPPAVDSRRTICLTLLAVALALFYRKPDAVLHPQFWAEDGAVFFVDNYYHGLGAIFTAYAGYFHVALRLVAWVTGFLPLVAQPALYAVATLGLTTAVAAKLFSPRVHLPHKPWLAVTIALMPRGNGEILLTLTALQWFLAILLILWLVQDEAETPLQALGDLAILVIVGLSGPFSILLLPMFVLRMIFVSRSAWSGLCTGVVAICAAVQLNTVLHSPAQPNAHPSLHQWAEAFIRRPVGSMFFGTHIADPYLNMTVAASLLAVLLALLAVLALRQRALRWTVTVFVGSALLVYLSGAYRFIKAPDALFGSFDAGERYFFLPKLLLVWLLIIHLDLERLRVLRGAIVGFLLLAVLAAGTDFLCPAYTDLQWTRAVWRFKHDRLNNIPINPPGLTIRLLKKPFPPGGPPPPTIEFNDLDGIRDIFPLRPQWVRSSLPVVRVFLNQQPFLQVHPVGEVGYDIPPDAKAVDAEFAIRPEAWQGAQRTDGVDFRIDYSPNEGPVKNLWDRVLKPSDVPNDRGVQAVHITLPSHPAGRVIFRTLPATNNGNYDWACWARVRFEDAPTTGAQ